MNVCSIATLSFLHAKFQLCALEVIKWLKVDFCRNAWNKKKRKGKNKKKKREKNV